jgi:hypothetical protein
MSIAIIDSTQLMEIHIKLPCFILCILLVIFLTFASEKLQHLFENNKLLHSLHCLLLTPHVLIAHHVHI